MAGIGNSYFDIIDLLVQTENTQSMQVAAIIELLMQFNAILDDAMAVQCNQGVTHKTTVRTGLPAVTWGQLYQGIPNTKGTTVGVEDATGFCEGLSGIDTRLLELSPDRAQTRLNEATAFLESLAQEMASTMIYGNSAVDPEKFTGFAPRFNSLTAANGGQIVDGGGTGSDNTSIWMVVWGENSCHTLYPRGTRAGVDRQDKGEQLVTDANGDQYFQEMELFRWHNGLCVRDWRQVVRVANVDVSNLQAGTVDIMKLLRQGFWKLKTHRLGENQRGAIYANSDVLEAIDAASTPTTSTSASYVRLRPDEARGKEVMEYRGFPLRQVDAILNTEAQIT